MQVIKKLSFTAKIKLFCLKPSQQNSTLLAGDNHCSNIFQASKDENTSVKLLSQAKKKKKKNSTFRPELFYRAPAQSDLVRGKVVHGDT